MGRGPAGQHPVVGARSRSGQVKTQAVADTGRITLHSFIRSNVAPGAILYTDEHRSYVGLDDTNMKASDTAWANKSGEKPTPTGLNLSGPCLSVDI